MLKERNFKQEVIKSFSARPGLYEKEAQWQRSSAQSLARDIAFYAPAAPPGEILEIGCGTGFVTREVAKIFPRRRLWATDISYEMTRFCQERLEALGIHSVRFQTIDGEALSGKNQYAVIVSGLTFQWFQCWEETLDRLQRLLIPGGLLFLSFPSVESFPEWKAACLEEGLPFTGNLLPSRSVLSALTTGVRKEREETRVDYYAHPRAFFSHLKTIGVGASLQRSALNDEQKNRLFRKWSALYPERISISYRIIYCAFFKEKKGLLWQ